MTATLAAGTEDLLQILQLQAKNLKTVLNADETKEQGFLTIQHDLYLLEEMHKLAPSVIIKDAGKVIAYALTMLKECSELIKGLQPMFAMFDQLDFHGQSIRDLQYYAMGQICVDRAYRSQGLFDSLYEHHKEIYKNQYDLILTEISTSNMRSLRAHQRVGFQEISRFKDQLDEWSIVGWPYKIIS